MPHVPYRALGVCRSQRSDPGFGATAPGRTCQHTARKRHPYLTRGGRGRQSLAPFAHFVRKHSEI